MKRVKTCCEICDEPNISILHYHHIIPRCDPRSTNNNNNIAILCPTCHSLVHAGEIIIIGVYKTTNDYNTMWFKKGCDPPIPEEFWLVKNNKMVITLKNVEDKSKLSIK